jgi:hypothetical protein
MNKSESRRIAKRIVRITRQLANHVSGKSKLTIAKINQFTEQQTRLTAIPLVVTSPV